MKPQGVHLMQLLFGVLSETLTLLRGKGCFAIDFSGVNSSHHFRFWRFKQLL